MNSKKEILIQVLKKLSPYRNLAEGVLALIESNYIDEKTIDSVLFLITQSLKTTKKGKEKERLEQSAQIVKKIQKKEMKQKDVEEAEKLLDQMQ